MAMTVPAAQIPRSAGTDEAESILAALSRLPLGRPLSTEEAADYAAAKAAEPTIGTEELLAKARARVEP